MKNRPERNRTFEERVLIYQAIVEGKSLDYINAQLPPEVKLPKSSYNMVTRNEARVIKEGRATLEELARRPLTRRALRDLLK